MRLPSCAPKPYYPIVVALFVVYAGDYFCKVHLLLLKSAFMADENISGPWACALLQVRLQLEIRRRSREAATLAAGRSRLEGKRVPFVLRRSRVRLVAGAGVRHVPRGKP